MAASPETSAASTVSQRLGRVSAGNAALASAASFADTLQFSLQESAASLKQVARAVGEETKTQAKGTSKKSDPGDASFSTTGASPQMSALPTTPLPTAVPVPAPVQTPSPSLAANSTVESSDDIDAGGATTSAQQHLSTFEVTASSHANFRSNLDPALNNELLQGAATATQNAQTSLADTANSPAVADLSGTNSNFSFPTPAEENRRAATPAPSIGSYRTSTVQTKTSQSSDLIGDKWIGQSGAGTGSEVPNEVSNATNSDSNATSAGRPGKESVSGISAPVNTAVNDASTQSNIQAAGGTSNTDGASALDQPVLATFTIDGGNDFAANASNSQTISAQPGNVASSTTSDNSSAITILAASQIATNATPTDSSHAASNETRTAPLSPDGDGGKQTTHAAAAPTVHAPTQNGNTLSTSLAETVYIRTEAKHLESGASNSGTTLPNQAFASAANPAPAQPSENPQSTSTQSPRTDTAVQVRPGVGPNPADTTQTNGAVVGALPSQFDPSPTTSKHDNKSDKVNGVSASSQPAVGGTSNTTALAQTTTTTQLSDTGSLTKPTASTANAALSHAQSANPPATQVLDDGPELSPAMHAWNGGENLQANLSGTPHVVEKLSQSEMNIAMQADALGAVQVRAHVAGDQVGAAITVEHHDVHAMLTNDLPSLHRAFADKQLRVENLSVQQGYFAGSGISDGKGGQQEPQQGTPQRTYPVADAQPGLSSATFFTTGHDSTESRGSFDSQGRLSVRA